MMADDEDAEIEEQPTERADLSWVGRAVMVTYSNGQVWYDGVVTRITDGGDFVEVEEEITAGWLWKRTAMEREWHDVDCVYLIHK